MKTPALALAVLFASLITSTVAFAGLDLVGDYTCDMDVTASPEMNIETSNGFSISRAGDTISFTDMTSGEMQTVECKTGPIEIAHPTAKATGTIKCSATELVLDVGFSLQGASARTKFSMKKTAVGELEVETDVLTQQKGKTLFATVTGNCLQN